jgi:hypothetical protein
MDELFPSQQMSPTQIDNLLRQLNIINRQPDRVFANSFDDIIAGAKLYGQNMLNPFLAYQTPLGLLELEKNQQTDTKTARLKRQDRVGETKVTSEVSKNLDTPEALARVLLQQPMYGGELSAQGTVGRGSFNEPVRNLEIQYLREILKNLGFGAYHQSSPYGSNTGLRLQGRF